MTHDNAMPDEFLAFLSGNVIDPSLVDPPSAASSRVVNFSSAFSQTPRTRPGQPPANPYDLPPPVEAHPQTSYSNPITADAFSDFGFLSDDIAVGGALPADDLHSGSIEAIAGPGPNSIAAAVARNGILGLEQYETDLPVLPSLDEAYPQPSYVDQVSAPTTQTNRTVAEGEAVPIKRKRGRPRTKPEKDPNEPPKKRGRPRKNAHEPSPAIVVSSIGIRVAPNESSAESRGNSSQPRPRTRAWDSASIQAIAEGVEYSSDASETSSRGSDRGSGRDGDEGVREGRPKRKKKRPDPPLVPRVFRLATRMRNTRMEDLNVHDLGRRVHDVVPEVSEEQKRELQRAMNPTFATRLLEALGEHSEYYDRAYKALHEELLAVQVEESLLEHVKEIALDMRNNIRNPLKTIEQIQQQEPTS